MRWKLGLGDSPQSERLLAVTTDATATVGDLAQTLARNDPLRQGQPVPSYLSLRVISPAEPQGRGLEPGATLHDAGLRSGARVELIEVGGRYQLAGADRGPAAVVVRVLSGPQAGQEFGLPVGTSYLGRAADSDVRLTDPLVSGRHARLTVGTSIELTDLNSANGILLGGRPVSKVSVRATDQLLLGDTLIAITPLRQAGAAPEVGAVVDFNRSPRVVAQFPEHKLAHPKPPQPLRPSRFPYIAMLAPLIMGSVMYAVTRNPLSVIFVALSPILMVGTWLDRFIAGKRLFKQQKKQFKQNIEALHQTIEREHAVERAVRQQRCPAVIESLAAVGEFTDLLWTRRPENPDFLSLRLGIGASPSKVRIDLPDTQDTDAESWEQLVAARDHCAVLPDAPVIVNLRECGSLGLAGPGPATAALARGLVWQLVSQQAASEVVLTALMSQQAKAGWEWLEWLPHVSSPHSPLTGDHLACDQASGLTVLAKLEELIDQRLPGEKNNSHHRPPHPEGKESPLPEPVVPTVLVLVTDDVPLDRARLTRLTERGPDVGVHVIWVAARQAALPAACRTFLALDDAVVASAPVPGPVQLPGVAGAAVQPPVASSALPVVTAAAGQVRFGSHDYPLTAELVDAGVATRMARVLAPVVEAGTPVEDDSDLPKALSYLALAGPQFAQQPDFVAERWVQTGSINQRDLGGPRQRRKPGGLVSLIGQAADGAMTLDLRTQGPHALVGGTTGAGKSEFLQAWVMGLATRYSPDRVTFLFVDYKGGAAFADCVQLPHCVGLVTDLSPHLVRRALTSLRAELRFREHLLNRKKAKDLIGLERSGDPEAPPSLIIVVDEFAALKQEVPEFVDGVIDVAQRGRSLGLHLILATQRPAGVINDKIRANVNLRIALRMADEADSQDILGDPMAAYFSAAAPGRAAAKTGPGRITPFQTGYVGGWTSDQPDPARIDIDQLDFGTAGRWEEPENPALAESEQRDPGPTDIARMVNTIGQAAQLKQLPEPRKPWLEPLASVYDLALLPSRRDDRHLVLGVMDDPDNQDQPVVYYRPDVDGNLAILGAGGTGKSTALRTIALSATFASRNGGPIHVYGLDFGAKGLQMLEQLPHVGAIIDGDDEERVIRLLRTLRALVEDRSARFGQVNASSITEYRQLANRPQEPRVLLLIDGMGIFREQYEFSNQSNWFNAFAQIAADGRPLGVHVVMTGDRLNSIPPSISSSVQQRIVLRLATDDDYLMVGVPKDVLDASSPPGRGLLNGNELQFAVWGADSNVAVQARETA
ncbi:MAG: FHA domain-containing protein, partial [Propionibacteriaceae bacterium]|nr:FHA domain-containing protein [Propionibacteriaceae bacterium]